MTIPRQSSGGLGLTLQLPVVHWRFILKVLAGLGGPLLTAFLVKLYRHRMQWRQAGLPGPPHDFIFGHMRAFGEVAQKNGKKHLDYTAQELAEAYGDGLIFLDLWPLGQPIVIVSDPQVADQIVRVDNLPKCLKAMTVHFPIFGEESLALAGGDEKGEQHWKTVRRSIAPGFKKGHLERSWTDDIVAVGHDFVNRLTERAEDSWPAIMAEYLIETTLDLILRVTIGSKDPILARNILDTLNAQLEHASALGVGDAIGARLNPRVRYSEWKRTKRMYDLLAPSVNEHIEQSKTQDLSLKPKLDVLDWALYNHPQFKTSTLVDQVKTFILAGHDTASSTLAWIYYHLSQSSDVLRKIREEHDRVLDSQDPVSRSTIGREGDIILADPGILNGLHYTLAVMREALRMYPPAAAVREAGLDVYEVEHHGHKYSVAGCMLWVNHWCLHRSKSVWGEDAHLFRPERWLDEQGNMKAPPSAWQPFSKGPRNCIGMEFGILEQKIILCMTVRKFDFEYAGTAPPFQTFRLTAQPHNGIPLRIRFAAKK